MKTKTMFLFALRSSTVDTIIFSYFVRKKSNIAWSIIITEPANKFIVSKYVMCLITLCILNYFFRHD